MKKIPYGLADFKYIQQNNYYFVDKTHFIEKLENLNESYMMFLRPRRFGKSLFIAILEAYYDKYYKKDFNTIFNDTYIGKNPTPKANSYLVMRFDFSGVDITDVENSFSSTLLNVMDSFIYKYKLNIEMESNPLTLFDKIFKYLNKHNLELFLLIDEYDHFANRLLFENRDNYFKKVADKTAMFKQFFTTLKTATSGNDSPLKRMFITGVTPMTMYDVTSGFNIGKNISLKKDFNSMVGFNDSEVDKILNYYKVDVDKQILKEWYNNYIFSQELPQPVYNTDMILYFISEYQSENKIPTEMIDINVRSDYSKLRHIIYTNKRLNGNFDSLRTLITGDTISVNNLVQDFSALNLEKESNFKSLMFYLGLVTIKNREFALNLKIPNETVKRIDIEFLSDTLKVEDMFKVNTDRLEEYLAEFALKGDITVFTYLAQKIKDNSSIRDYIYKEQHIKAMYIAYLSLTPYYIIKSELELNKGFVDILIKPFNNSYIKYFALLEFKYINRDETITKQKIEKLTQEAKEQLNRYQNDELVTQYIKQDITLKKIILIFHGWEMVKLDEV
jgi:hypothetical protein